MGTNADITKIICLPMSKRLKVIEDIWDSIVLEQEAVDVPEWHREELRRRLKVYESKPKSGAPWPDVRRRIEENYRSKS